jgi:RNA ligase
MECRGLIVKADGTVVARPFKKFLNIEQYQGEIPLEPFTVTEKVDGSLGVLYFAGGRPFIATRGSFVSEQAVKGNELLRQYDGFAFDPDYTYLFEIIYPGNRVVVDYGSQEMLVLLAVIETETGRELDLRGQEWPFPVVRQYDGIRDIGQLKSLEEPNREGFVVRFESGLRLKVKFAEYLRLHRILTRVTVRTIWEMMRDGKSLDVLLERVPDEFYGWVSETRADLLRQYAEVEEQAREIYEGVKDLPTRKEQAAAIGKQRYGAIAFRMLDGKSYTESIWRMLKPQAERPFREDEA